MSQIKFKYCSLVLLLHLFDFRFIALSCHVTVHHFVDHVCSVERTTLQLMIPKERYTERLLNFDVLYLSEKLILKVAQKQNES